MDRLNEVTKDCFNAVVQLRRIDPARAPAPETLHPQLRSAVDTMIRRATDAGYSREDAMDMAYAIVALMDEAVLGTPGPTRQYWMSRPLQLHFFQENTAGDGFYTRLDAIRGNPARVDVLRVYFLCLAFGFLGRYGMRGGEAELAAIYQGVEQDLARAGTFGGEALSPHGERPPEPRAVTQRALPLVAIGVAALVISVGVYVGLRVSIGQETPAVIHAIDDSNPR